MELRVSKLFKFISYYWLRRRVPLWLVLHDRYRFPVDVLAIIQLCSRWFRWRAQVLLILLLVSFHNFNNRYVAIINTYLALSSACVATFIASILTNPKKKITMEHIQNATLAGDYQRIINYILTTFKVVSQWEPHPTWMSPPPVPLQLVSPLVFCLLLATLISRLVSITFNYLVIAKYSKYSYFPIRKTCLNDLYSLYDLDYSDIT